MADRVGQQLGNYRLSRLLGRGGFAEVYLGEHVYLKTPAAIKLLQGKLANEEDLQAFLKEAQTIAQLVHPHIVRVLDFGVDGETPFLVMDYAMGGTLRQRHPRGTQLPLTTIVPYITQVAEALQYAHEEKFIHRDVKPENMLVGRRDTVLLSDFGIALIAQSSRYQNTQDVIGTIAYMSPEQIQGKPRQASDQYSLGIVVYEWLCGEHPFHGSFTELCTQHMFASPPPLREKMPTISPDVEQVVMTALAKEPRQRFASVQAFASALEQASRVNQPHSSIQSPSLIMTSPAMPLSQQTVASSPVEGVQTLPTPPDQPRQVVSSSRLQNRPEPVRQGISRRAMLLGLGGAGLAGVTSGLTWLLSSRSSHPTLGAWYDGNYLYKKSITIDHTKVVGGSDLRNFPVLISLPGNSNSDLRTATNGGYVRNSNGYDIIFTDSTETVKLDHEIETYNASTGEIEMWVRIPSLSATTATVISMYFGNSSISSSQENRTGVWDSNYQSVWHMGDNAANTTVKESTSSGNNGIALQNTSNMTTTGKIDGALSFNGSSDYIYAKTLTGLQGDNSRTISMWIKTNSITQQVFFDSGNTQNIPQAFEIGLTQQSGVGLSYYNNSFPPTNIPGVYSGFWSDDIYVPGQTLTDNNWHQIVVTLSGTTVSIYINGSTPQGYTWDGQSWSSLTSQPFTLAETPNTVDNPIWIGRGRQAMWTHGLPYFKGSIDEVQISNTARSSGWIITEYNNQSSPSTFYSVSSLVSR